MIWIVLAWILYYFIHSFLAHQKVKEYLYSRFPRSKRYYRIIFNIIAILGLSILIPLSILSCDKLIFKPSIFTTILGSIFILLGLIIMFKAFQIFNLKEFFGLEQLNASNKSNKLIIEGLYKYVRHPLYTGLLFFIFGIWIIYPTLVISVFVLISIAYIDYGSSLEEDKLQIEFGATYTSYRKKVKKLIPFIY